MSGVVMSRYPDRIEVFTDGGHYEYDEAYGTYVLTGARSKTHILPHLSAVLCSIGTGDFLPNLIWNWEERWSSFDVLVAGFEADMDHSFWHLQRVWKNTRSIMVVVFIGGFSVERDRWETYSTFVDRDGKVTPLRPETATCLMPTPAAAEMTKVGLIHDDKGNLNVDSWVGLGLLIQAMRLVKGPIGARENPPDGHGLGAHIQHTVLTRDRAVSRIVHRWDDEVGQPIEPKDDEIEKIKISFGVPAETPKQET